MELREGGVVLVRNRRGGNRGGVELSREHPWAVKVHGGTWNSVLDLTGLRVTGVELDSGAGNVTCTLPAPVGIVPLRVNSGIVGVTLRRPRGAAVHAVVSSGSAKVRLDDRAIRAVTADVQWDTPGALDNPDRYELIVSSGCVRVTLDELGARRLATSAPLSAAERARRRRRAADSASASPSSSTASRRALVIAEGVAGRAVRPSNAAVPLPSRSRQDPQRCPPTRSVSSNRGGQR